MKELTIVSRICTPRLIGDAYRYEPIGEYRVEERLPLPENLGEGLALLGKTLNRIRDHNRTQCSLYEKSPNKPETVTLLYML